MTREELFDKIKLKREENGGKPLSDEECIDFGVMMRGIRRYDRDWASLVKATGWPYSPEALRGRVKYHLKDKDIALKENDVKEDDEGRNLTQELYKARQLLRDERTNLNRMLRDEARIERMHDTIVEVVNELNELPKVEYKDGKHVANEAVAMISDWHIGMEIDEYCNKYNIDVATKRIDKWVKDVISYCKCNEVKRLNVVNLGDLIHGDIHVTIRIEEEFDVITQVMKASELLARALNRLCEAAPEVIYRSCSDNHARITPNKKESIEKENFFRLIDWFVEERLKDTKIEFMHDNLSVSMGKFRLMNGKLVMFAHGHMNKPNRAFQDFIGATEEYINYVLLGHYHCEKTKMFQNMKVLVNGSACGVDNYAESIRQYTKPAQTLLVFDKDNVINYSINLDIQ